MIASVYGGLPVVAIGERAFYECENLTSVTIQNGVTSIGRYAFYGCSKLASVEIPDGVLSIGDSAFALCTSLTNIRFGGTVAKWELIVKGMLWNSDVPATQTVCVDGSTAP